MHSKSKSSSSGSSRKLWLLIVAVISIAAVLVYKYFTYSSSSSGASKVLQMSSVDVLAGEVPQESQGKGVQVQEKYISVKGVEIFYREAIPPQAPPRQQVLLLHGQAFTSQNWHDLGTLSSLAAWGHRAVAVDLPGYGKSKSASSSFKESPAEFLSDLIDLLKLGGVVIVSPSMSGRFSLPFLCSHPEKVKGYIPVAPVTTEKYVDRFPVINVPTVIVVGEKDEGIGPVSVKNLSLLPNHSLVTLPQARHPAYLDQPQLWHKLLHNFLQALPLVAR